MAYKQVQGRGKLQSTGRGITNAIAPGGTDPNKKKKKKGDKVSAPSDSYSNYGTNGHGTGDFSGYGNQRYNKHLTDSLSQAGLPTGNYAARVHDARQVLKSQGDRAGARKLNTMEYPATNHRGNRTGEQVAGAKNRLERTLMSIEQQRKNKLGY